MHKTDDTSRTLSSNKKLFAFFIDLYILCAASIHTFLFCVQKTRARSYYQHKRNCTFIVHNPVCRLGNNLFQFASAFGLSLQHSCWLYLGPDMITALSQYFEIKLLELLTQSVLNIISPIEQLYNHCTHIPNLIPCNESNHLELAGYWQAHTYFLSQTDPSNNNYDLNKQL